MKEQIFDNNKHNSSKKLGFADYAALEKNAKESSRADLEEFYIKTKNVRVHTTCGNKVGIIVFCLMMIALIYGLGVSTGGHDQQRIIGDNLKAMTPIVCQDLPENYITPVIFKNDDREYTNKIDCTNLETNPKP